VVAGLERGICTMKKGEKALFMLPPLAYEDSGAPGVRFLLVLSYILRLSCYHG